MRGGLLGNWLCITCLHKIKCTFKVLTKNAVEVVGTPGERSTECTLHYSLQTVTPTHMHYLLTEQLCSPAWARLRAQSRR